MNSGRSAPIERAFSLQEAARYVGVSEQSIRRWAKQGKITHHKVGDDKRKQFRFFRSDLDKFIERPTPAA